MRTKFKLIGLTTLLLFISTGCLVTKIERVVYRKVEKAPESTTVVYHMPTVTPFEALKQMQKKGDMTVSSEIVAFKTVPKQRSDENVVPTANKEFDKYEIRTIPYYEVAPDRILFNIRLRNQSARILKLADVAFVLSVDGVQVSLEDEYLEQWISGMILPGNEKDYAIKGPLVNSLPDKCVIRMSLFDMPVTYDGAGNVSKKENFEWYYTYVREKVEREATIRYTYEERPVYKETCSACQGAGGFTTVVACTTCSGNGKYTNKQDKVVSCYSCSGTGKRKQTKDCATCDAGKIARRKSGDPTIDEKWTGYKITVATTPTVQVSVFDPETQTYKQVGYSGRVVDWWASSSKGQGNIYPIKLHYEGKEWLVKPENEKGQIISKMQVDFSSGKAKMIKGKLVTTG